MALLPLSSESIEREDGAPVWWYGEQEATALSLRGTGLDLDAFVAEQNAKLSDD